MQSLGRVGRILSGSLDPGPFSSSSKESTQQNLQLESPTNVASATSEKTDSFKSQHLQKSDDTISQSSNYSLVTSNSVSNQINTVLQEPDVIASTKLSQSKTTDSVSQSIRLDLISNTRDYFFRLLQRVHQCNNNYYSNQLLHHVENAIRIENYQRRPRVNQFLVIIHSKFLCHQHNRRTVISQQRHRQWH